MRKIGVFIMTILLLAGCSRPLIMEGKQKQSEVKATGTTILPATLPLNQENVESHDTEEPSKVATPAPDYEAQQAQQERTSEREAARATAQAQADQAEAQKQDDYNDTVADIDQMNAELEATRQSLEPGLSQGDPNAKMRYDSEVARVQHNTASEWANYNNYAAQMDQYKNQAWANFYAQYPEG